MPKDLTARSRITAYLSSHGPIEDEHGRATALLKDAVGYAGSSLGFVQLISSMEKSGTVTREVRGKRTYKIAGTGPVASPGGSPLGADGFHQSVQSVTRTVDLRDGVTGADSTDEDSAVSSTGTLSDNGSSGNGSSGNGSSGNGSAGVGSSGNGSAGVGSSGVDTSGIDYDELAASLLSQAVRALANRSDAAQPVASVRRRLDQLALRNAELEREAARARAERDSVIAERDELRRQLEAASHNLSLLTERLGTPRKQVPRGAADRLDSEERALLYRLSERGSRPREAAG